MKLIRVKTLSTLHGIKPYANGVLCATWFAQGLSQRYVRRRKTWRVLYLLMRTASYGIVQQILNRREVHRHLVIQRTPLANGMGMPSAAHADARKRASVIYPLASRTQQDSFRKTSAHKLLWLDIVERHRRIEVSDVKRRRLTATRVSKEPISQMLPALHPQTQPSSMPLVVRTAREPTQDPTPAKKDVPGKVLDPATLSYAANNTRGTGSRSAASMPEHDVDSLAERVIGRIDQRIAAQRERLGRP